MNCVSRRHLNGELNEMTGRWHGREHVNYGKGKKIEWVEIKREQIHNRQ